MQIPGRSFTTDSEYRRQRDQRNDGYIQIPPECLFEEYRPRVKIDGYFGEYGEK